jgi:ribonuclease D
MGDGSEVGEAGGTASGNATLKTTITQEELNLLPLRAYAGKVHVVTDPKHFPKLAAEIVKHKVVGFDTETRPSFKKGQSYKLALLQLATPSSVYLIRTHHTGLDRHIISVFENPNVIKAGVAIRDDIKALQTIAAFTPQSFVELANLSRQVGLQVESVKKLAALVLGFRISKSAQTSNWEAPTLTEKQIEYAATDAWVCLELYERMKSLERKSPH